MSDTYQPDGLANLFAISEADDGFGGQEGTFSICSFWFAEALARAGRLEEARLVLEKYPCRGDPCGLPACSPISPQRMES